MDGSITAETPQEYVPVETAYALETDLSAAQAEIAAQEVQMDAVRYRAAAAEQANEGLRKDAQRYQFLRNAEWPCISKGPAYENIWRVTRQRNIKIGSDAPTGERLDAAIDSAIAREGKS